jgi:hypothetical protein
MPLQKLQFRPGLNREGTIYSTEGGWYDGDKIRFRSGLPEKIGGWTQVASTQYDGICRSLWVWTDGDGGAGALYIGLGTNTNYYIYTGGVYNDITPVVQTDTLTNPFTGNGTTTVTVTDASYSPNLGDSVYFTSTAPVEASVGWGVDGWGVDAWGGYYGSGITISGAYIVTSVISSTQYTIQVSTPVTGTGGGTVTASYKYPSGLNIYTSGNGWGAGPWSRGTWGSAYSTGVGQQLRLWTNDNFGNDLVIAPRGGPIFYWQDANGVSTPAVYLSSLANSTSPYTLASVTFSSGASTITVGSTDAPYIYPFMVITGTHLPAGTQVAASYVTGSTSVPITTVTTGAQYGSYTLSYAGGYVPTATYQVIASEVQEFIIAFGANPYTPGAPTTTVNGELVSNSPFNPLLVRWSDQANALQWIPQLTNQAGEYTLTNGSYIMGARATRQEILVWTDSALYSMQYIGAPYVWGFQLLMDNTSIMSPNCMITVNNITYWMGRDRFYMYDGTVKTLPCSLKQYVFEDINQSQSYQVFAGANEGFNEIWWFYCSIDGNGGTIANPNSQVDKYVVYNYLDNCWYYGSMARSAWYQTGIVQYPIAADYNNRLLYQENGNDDNATGTPLSIDAYIQSSDFDIGDGQNFGFVWRMLPDVNFNSSTCNNPAITMQLQPRLNSGSAYDTTTDNPQVQSPQNFNNVPAYTVNQFTGQVYTRVRGRQMALRVESTGLGTAWQLGAPRVDIRPDGRR